MRKTTDEWRMPSLETFGRQFRELERAELEAMRRDARRRRYLIVRDGLRRLAARLVPRRR